ncbi:universal stress protein [Candidatus Gracilibacteria bacterium]|nr:universal stress protein [Candidatus Gracilibacteria bacterium]
MYTHILVPLDGSPLAEQILPHVRALAEVGSKPKITLLRAVPREYPDIVEGETTNNVVDPMTRLLSDARSYLERTAALLRSEGLAVAVAVLVRQPSDAIVEFANREQVDLIAIATHGRGGVGRLVFGSVTEKIMHLTPAPMLVVRPQV